ncbi:MAG: MBL fold metallo-hydrolase [Candidatus Micrarchaeota archaeon]|nr:MBL fold metallo-hydrolase [Candidatus Micrarchaeota archaeon]
MENNTGDRKLFFCGGAMEVGKNAVLYKSGKVNMMFDYGIKLNPQPSYPIKVNEMDLILLSHAHLDHSGFIPYLYEEKEPLLLTTFPTLSISEVLWDDSAKIMGENLPYQKKNVKKILSNVFEIEYEMPFRFSDKKISFFDAGHILGSGIIKLEEADGFSILYTCDMNASDTRMHKGCKTYKADALILESTYAFKEHENRRELEKKLIDKAKDVLKNDGLFILPSFAVGRTQELISILSEVGSTIYVDGMGNAINEIYLKNRKLINDYNSFLRGMKAVKTIQEEKERKKLMSKGGIVIATAGMLEGGPALKYILNSPKNSEVIFTGYCVEGTNGWRLQKTNKVLINSHEVDVDIPVDYYDFSAHSGRSDLLKFVNECNPKKIFCMHGDACKEFAEELKSLGFDAVAPENGHEYNLGNF